MKISNAKRSQHVKNKKNYTKPLKKKEAAAAASKKGADKKAASKTGGSIASNKVFGKPPVDKAKRRDKRNQVGKLLPLPPPPSAADKARDKAKKPGQKKGGEVESEEESEEEYNAQDMIDMMDDDERDNYQAAPTAGQANKKRKRAADVDDVNVDRSAQHFEKQYAEITNTESHSKKRMVSLLPIKTKGGEVVTRQTEVEDDDDEEVPEPEDELGADDDGEDNAAADSDDDVIRDDAVSECLKPIIDPQN